MSILKEIGGKFFQDLEPRQQGVLEDYSLNINLIKPPTPDRIKFDIFDRVNRGGTRLNNQEMRNAIYHGNATELLKELANNELFIKVTENSINSKRMKDRYIILRFIGFYLLNTCNELQDNRGRPIEYKSDIDDFLGKIMQFINRQNDEFLDRIKLVFKRAMSNSFSILGAGCFRLSRYIDKYDKNLPLNMALFESLAYLCSFEIITRDCEQVQRLVKDLFTGTEFIQTVSVPVDSSLKVNERFRQMNKIIRVLKND